MLSSLVRYEADSSGRVLDISIDDTISIVGDWIVKLTSRVGNRQDASGSLKWMDCAQDHGLVDSSGAQVEGVQANSRNSSQDSRIQVMSLLNCFNEVWPTSLG